MTPQDLKEWIEILTKPTAGVVGIIIFILYREAVIHIMKSVADVIASWLKRK